MLWFYLVLTTTTHLINHWLTTVTSQFRVTTEVASAWAVKINIDMYTHQVITANFKSLFLKITKCHDMLIFTWCVHKCNPYIMHSFALPSQCLITNSIFKSHCCLYFFSVTPIVGLALVVLVFGYILSVFRMKYGGYPYRLVQICIHMPFTNSIIIWSHFGQFPLPMMSLRIGRTLVLLYLHCCCIYVHLHYLG